MPCLYPPADDSQRRTGVTSDWDSIAYLRDGLPRHLSGMGTETAGALLNQLIAEHPQLTQLAYDLTLAERAVRLKTWSPPSPKEVLAIADTPTLTLVNSAAELGEILTEALAKFADSLHGAQNQVRDLWDRQAGGKEVYRPIDENGFTDVIARFLRSELERRGIFANREVDVGRVPGARPSAAARTFSSTRFAADPTARRMTQYRPSSPARPSGHLSWSGGSNWTSGTRPTTAAKGVPKMTADEVRADLERQADRLPDGIMVHPVVVECRAPS